MGRALILDPERWLPLDQWIKQREPGDGWQVAVERRGGRKTDRYDLVFIIGEAVGLNRERIAEVCAERGWNPLQAVPFPCDLRETASVEQLLSRWDQFFKATLRTWQTVPQVAAERLYPNKRIALFTENETERTGRRIESALKKWGLDVAPQRDDCFFIRHGLDFQVFSPEGSETVGAIILVPEEEDYFSLRFPEEVTETRRIITLSELAKKMHLRRFRLETVVFLVPRVTTPPALWKKVFTFSRSLAERHGSRVVVLCSETVVAGDALEEDYREARKAGVLFEKTDLGSVVFLPTLDMRKVIMRFRTERDRFETELSGHWIVAVPEPKMIPFDLATRFREDRLLRPIVRPENVNLGLHTLNEPGMFLFSNWLSSEELDSAVQDVYGYLAEGVVREKGRLEVDEEKCVLCLTCLRTCPWGAVCIEGESKRRKAQVRWELCRVCGLCASSCPASAISITGHIEKRQNLELAQGGARR
ncbi:MAG TPA: 4Fe-4S binding protein [Atribacteraceae bacterium]|nr:4Fe-4S binding protein [Atribacteraceae bacterium]